MTIQCYFMLCFGFGLISIGINPPLVGCFTDLFPKNDPDFEVSFEQLVTSRGFDYETHRITTDDGYILTLHRIVSESFLGNRNLKPVILQHGMFGSSNSFLINAPFLYSKKSASPKGTTLDPTVDDYLGDNLGFDLALTKRYDVWLSNSRGVMANSELRRQHHVNLSTSDPKFWEFSFEEKGMYDLPTIIDFIRDYTGHQTVGYCGYSLGTTIAIVLITMRPEYADILQPIILLAPAIYLNHITTPVRHLAPMVYSFCQIEGQFPVTKYWYSMFGPLCPRLVRDNILTMFTGYTPGQLNETRMLVYLSQTMTPVSFRDLCHYVTNYHTGRFARFDFGSNEINEKRYGQSLAPDYPLKLIRNNTKLAFFTGLNDYLVSREDVKGLKMFLQEKTNAQIVLDYVVPVPGWSHIDFTFGINAGQLVYAKVIEVLDKFTK